MAELAALQQRAYRGDVTHEEIHNSLLDIVDTSDDYYFRKLAECFPDISMARMLIREDGLEDWEQLFKGRSVVKTYVTLYRQGVLKQEMQTLWSILDEYYGMVVSNVSQYRGAKRAMRCSLPNPLDGVAICNPVHTFVYVKLLCNKL